MNAVVLFSGGLDSTTLLTKLIRELKAESILAVTARYGSIHETAETSAAARIVKYFQHHANHVDAWPIKLPDAWQGSNSALLAANPGEPIPEKAYEREGPQPTVVPFRNGVLIATAVAIAESQGYDSVWIAAHASDSANWAYPDCSPEFVGGMMGAAYAGTMGKVRVNAPFLWMRKKDVIMEAAMLRAPLHLAYSCYRGEQMACGRCPTCIERIEAFAECGFIDPGLYEPTVQLKGAAKWPMEGA